MIVVLGGAGRSTRIVTNCLAQDFEVVLIQEQPTSPKVMLQRRAKRLGWPNVIGQALFIGFTKLQAKQSAGRIAEIEAQNSMRATRPMVLTYKVDSVNDDRVAELLRKLSPQVVVVNGTRILSERTLRSVSAPFINTHAGITPKYRGVHGTYWALARNDPENAGVTVHLVDAGIDTGGVLYQARVQPTHADNFSTYPTLQLAAGLPLLKQAVRDALSDNLRVIETKHKSQLFYHPTIWTYLSGRLRGVR